MKKATYLLTFSAFIYGGISNAQENVLPENGNVGLGTTSPSARLTVAGSTRIDSTLTVNDSVFMASSARVGEDLKVEGNLFLPNIPQLTNWQNETLLLTDENGLVKKGSGDNFFEALKSRIYAPPYPGNHSICNLVGYIPTWANGPNKLFSECPEVWVGIGTNTPTRNLDVRGDIKALAHVWAQGSLSVGADNNLFSKLAIMNTNRTAVIQGSAVGNTKPYQRLMFFEYDYADTKILEVINPTTGRTTFTLNANGVMEIDNGVRKTFAIDANGLTRAREIKIDMQTWPDYVFQKDYKLLSLSEVEDYIKENGHLPEVPSATTIEQEGLNLGETDKLLMQKVEELTLYLIEQQKRIQQLEEELKSLKN